MFLLHPLTYHAMFVSCELVKVKGGLAQTTPVT